MIVLAEQRRFFYHPNGKGMYPVKAYGNQEVPKGCFYEEHEIYKVVRSRIEDSILPFLESMMQTFRAKSYMSHIGFEVSLNPTQNLFGYDLSGENRKKGIYEVSKADLKDILKDFGNFEGIVNWGFKLRMNCYKEIPNDIQFWGGIFDVRLRTENWDDESEEVEFPVWKIWIGDLSMNIEDKLNEEFMERLLQMIEERLNEDYKLNY